MNTKTRIAFWCYVIALAGSAAWAVVYLLRTEFMPYHAVAVGMPWSAVPAGFQVLIIGFMKLGGGVQVTALVALFVMLLIPFRQGARWARWAVPVLLLLYFASMANAMAHVWLNSPAQPPWNSVVVGVALVIVGAALSLPPRR